jgi:AcrR family transcriptional regulator
MSPVSSNKTDNLTSRQARAEQILSAAAELFARFGYKRVTIDDIATQADIGRGTIYQFWKTRQALYSAVLEREFLAVIEEILGAIRRDPKESLTHRIVRAEFLAVMRHPILHAIFTADESMLGKSSIDDVLSGHQNMIFREYRQLMVEHGLLRDDITDTELDHALTATVIGFFLVEPFSENQDQLDLDRQADLLATTVQRAFETEASLDAIQVVAPLVIELFTEIANDIQSHLHQAYE